MPTPSGLSCFFLVLVCCGTLSVRSVSARSSRGSRRTRTGERPTRLPARDVNSGQSASSNAAAPPSVAAALSDMPDDEAVEASLEAKKLYAVWTGAYGVETKARRTLRQPSHVHANFSNWSEVLAQTELDLSSRSSAVGYGSSCPRAPHLQCCDWLSRERAASERRGPNGEPPSWTEPQPSSDPAEGPYPRPPWIRGHPRDNLPLTHRAQTDIWVNQFPADGCAGKDTRFLVTWWDDAWTRGFGSQLHLLTGVLGIAMKYRRVLVLHNSSMERADHEGCTGIGKGGSLECYFSIPSSKECERRVMDIWINSRKPMGEKLTHKVGGPRNIMDVINSNQTWVEVPNLIAYTKKRLSYPTNWGEPWLQGDGVLNFGYRPWETEGYDYYLKANWWRAQGLRFLLRWPSPYLCHLLNFARHQTYGLQVAQAWVAQQSKAGAQCSFPQEACPDPPSLLPTKEASLTKTQEPSTSTELHTPTFLLPRAYLPHPVVQIYYRGTDKVSGRRREMRLVRFSGYLEAADTIAQRMFKGQRLLWLISEDETAFLDVGQHKEWTRYWLAMDMKHQGAIWQWAFARQFGIRHDVEASLCNLFLCESSDALVLPLSSNWGRVINELRITGGRLRTPLHPVNYGEMP